MGTNGARPSRAESAQGAHSTKTIRFAAAGDVHCRESHREEVASAFAALPDDVDLLLLAGDLTTCGEPAEAAVLAAACDSLSVPVVAVLGNHDWHAGRAGEVASILEDAGIEMLERSSTVHDIRGYEVGIVGCKGFVGGYGASHLPDFGEPLLRRLYAETSADVDAVGEGLGAIANCPLRIVLLHYAPTDTTLVGERRDIWAFLGTDRLAAPIVEHQPDLVLHGHAHAGRLKGSIGEVPVYNVSVPVMERDFWLFELSVRVRPATPIR
jgi:Icc-related predicted phosphoesterase